MKIVVTGATGSVGTALRRQLDFVGIARGVTRPGADLTLDVGSASGLREAFADADVVVHLAWAIKPTDARTNVEGSRNVLRAALEAGVGHVVCASSVAAYAPAPRWQRVDESWPVTGIPGSRYSAHKVELERMVAAHPAPIAVVRPCAISQASAAAQLRRWLLSPLFPKRLIGSAWLPVPLWRQLRMQLVHADDVATVIRLIVERRATGPFNVASPEVLTAGQLAETAGAGRVPVSLSLLKAVAWPTALARLQPLHPAWLELADSAPLVSTTRAHEDLEWWPRCDARDVLRETVTAMAQRRSA